MTDRESDRDEREERRDLRAAERVLHEPAGAEAAHVHARQDDDDAERDEGPRRDDERDPGQRQRDEWRAIAGQGHEASQVAGERHGARGDGPGEAGDERRPAGQKRRQRSERLPQVDVLAARTRPERRQFRVRHRAHEREGAAGEPDGQHRPRVADKLRHENRDEEDAAADHVRDNDRGRVERTEPAVERGRQRGHVRQVGVIWRAAGG